MQTPTGSTSTPTAPTEIEFRGPFLKEPVEPVRKKCRIPFNRPFLVGKELFYISQAVLAGQLAGDGRFTHLCQEIIESKLGAEKVLLTHSCTAALEMAALLFDIGEGDEVIMPSYTFVSTANAFALRGATPVFVDIRRDTLNIDEELIEKAITPRTKAIVVVHYAGVACEMDKIMDIAARHGLRVCEDAAHGLNATYGDRHQGTIADVGTFSFHETKNCISGEGGALVINDPSLIERAEILREKGTNRAKFFRGEVDKYTWVDTGSSYLPSEVVAAFLYAQLEVMDDIDRRRLAIWARYRRGLADLEGRGLVALPQPWTRGRHNAHMFYMTLSSEEQRDELAAYLKSRGILAVHHYVPLHSSPVGLSVGRTGSTMEVTDDVSARLIRLPLFFDLSEADQTEVIDEVHAFFA